MLLILACVLAIGTLLALASHDAQATRELKSNKPLASQRLTLPLELPALKPVTDVPAIAEETTALEWIKVTVKNGDTLSRIFQRQQIDQSEIPALLKNKSVSNMARTLVPGQQLEFVTNDGKLQQMVLRKTPLESWHVRKQGDEVNFNIEQRALDKRIAYSQGVITSSLFESGLKAGLSTNLVMEMAAIFGWDIDFALDIREGDEFRLSYEEHFLDGKKVADGPVLAAEFINQKKSYRAIRYTDPDGRSDYYSPEGLSMRKAFLRTPVDFSRISSRFGKRHHPVLNRMRMHNGVDYSARTGTPIKAAGDGKIIYRGRKGGYGRTIIIQHGGRYSTLYAHMSSYRSKLRVGSRVKQGQVIGYVGQSGLATGPHLHYEFRVHGAHRNPLTVRLPNARPINSKYKEAFLLHAQNMMALLNMNSETRVAMNQP